MNEKSKNTNKESKKEHKSGRGLGITIGSIIILVISTITFVFVPAMTQSITDEKLPPFGSYNGKKIEYTQGSYFAQMVETYNEQLKNNGQAVNEQSYFYIFNSAFAATVVNYGITDEVKQSGYVVPSKLIDRTMIPYFYDTNGNYSAKIYRDTPDSTKIEMRTSIEEQLFSSRYVEDIFGTNTGFSTTETNMYGLKSSKNEIDFVADMSSNKRGFSMVSFNTSDYPKAEAATFGKANAELFTKYNLSVVTLSSEAEAKKILKQINNDEILFGDAVTEYSTKQYSDENGIIANSYNYQIKNIVKNDADFQKITSLSQDSLTDVIETASGYSIFKANGAPVAADFSDLSLIDVAYNYMITYEAGVIEDYYTNIAKDFTAVATTKGFNAAASAYDLETVTIEPFPVNYGNNTLLPYVPTEVEALQGVQTNENFLQTAFTLQNGEISAPMVIGKKVVVLQLTNETQSDDGYADSLAFMYPYYTSQFDQTSVQSYFMENDKLENKFFDVYFNYFLGK
jgi:hypothetical protein